MKFYAAVYEEVCFKTIKLFNSEYSILIPEEYMKSEFAGNIHIYTLSPICP